MPLPKEYLSWPEEAKKRYQSVKKCAASLHSYIDVTDKIGACVNQLIHKAEELDAGDGLLFEKAEIYIKKTFLTQTFH